MKDTLIISNHHRRSLFFEETMSRLYNAGFTNIFIQDTGNEAWGKYIGPSSIYRKCGSIPYDRGMELFRRTLNYSVQLPFKQILMIDNDCFISDPNVVDEFIDDFIGGGYDFSCHLVSKNYYSDLEFNNSTIAEVKNQQFEATTSYPGYAPIPHWENAYLLITEELWNSLSVEDVSHSRKWIKAMIDKGAKLGAHQADYRVHYSHYGKGWFHVGNLMSYYSRLESQSPQFPADSLLDMSRLGYFLAQIDRYGTGIYPPVVEANLVKLTNGGLYSIAKEAWAELIEDTCMEGW